MRELLDDDMIKGVIGTTNAALIRTELSNLHQNSFFAGAYLAYKKLDGLVFAVLYILVLVSIVGVALGRRGLGAAGLFLREPECLELALQAHHAASMAYNVPLARRIDIDLLGRHADAHEVFMSGDLGLVKDRVVVGRLGAVNPGIRVQVMVLMIHQVQLAAGPVRRSSLSDRLLHSDAYNHKPSVAEETS